jgi:glutaredoxin 3
MAEVLIYTKGVCPYCTKAKTLLSSKNQPFTEISLDEHPEKIEEMLKLCQKQTVPQIFINGQCIGGFDDINSLNQQGKLDKLLQE